MLKYLAIETARICLSLTCTASLLPYFSVMNSSTTVWDKAIRQFASSRHMMIMLPKRVSQGKPRILVDLHSPSSSSVFSRCLNQQICFRMHENLFAITAIATSRSENRQDSLIDTAYHFSLWRMSACACIAFTMVCAASTVSEKRDQAFTRSWKLHFCSA